MLSKRTYVNKTYKHRLVILLVKNTYEKILLFKRRILNEIKISEKFLILQISYKNKINTIS